MPIAKILLKTYASVIPSADDLLFLRNKIFFMVLEHSIIRVP